jgi:exosortase/archaeosortase family protein
LSDPGSHNAIYVSWGCSGADATFILVSAILVYPKSISAKLLGLISGFVAVKGLNVIRIITLYQLKIYSQQLFKFANNDRPPILLSLGWLWRHGLPIALIFPLSAEQEQKL